MYAMICKSPVENAKFYRPTLNDVIKYLDLSEIEAIALVETLDPYFSFWYKGESHENSKKWNLGGDDGYADFSVKNYILACICDMYKAAKEVEENDFIKIIEDIPGLRKWIHFSKDRVTIKDMYFGKWKNFWKFF